VKGWKKIYKARGNQKQAEVAILISDKADLKQKSGRRDKGLHTKTYILIKGSDPARRYNNLNMYLNFGAPNFIKRTLLSIKEETGPDTIAGNLNTPVPSIVRTFRQKKKKKLTDILRLNNTINEILFIEYSIL
jgi:hypothetical protein